MMIILNKSKSPVVKVFLVDITRWMFGRDGHGYHYLISSFDVGLTSEEQAKVRDCVSRLNASAV